MLSVIMESPYTGLYFLVSLLNISLYSLTNGDYTIIVMAKPRIRLMDRSVRKCMKISKKVK